MSNVLRCDNENLPMLNSVLHNFEEVDVNEYCCTVPMENGRVVDLNHPQTVIIIVVKINIIKTYRYLSKFFWGGYLLNFLRIMFTLASKVLIQNVFLFTWFENL